VARLRTIAGVLLAALLVVGTLHWVESIGGPGAVRERYGWFGIVVSLFAHWMLNLTPFGTMVPMGVANGAVWGFWLGALVSWSGWMAASLTQYLFVRRLGTTYDVQARLDRLPARMSRFPVAHPVFQVGGRSLPWVGLHLVNVTSAVRGVPIRRFLLCAALGQAGPALMMAAVGAGLVSGS
jgi:uncharacterized membrane protein YdjX (TVP38/TMEM64 family)